MLTIFTRIFIPIIVVLLAVMGCNTSNKAHRLKSDLPERVCLSPEQVHLFNQLYHEAVIRLEQEEYDAHIVLLERALEIDSSAAEALWMLARAQYFFAGRNDSVKRQKSVHNMQRAVYYNPHDVELLGDLAMMFDYEERREEALQCYERIVEQHPTLDTQFQLAKSYWRLQRYEDALEVFNQMERQSGQTHNTILGKLGVYGDMKDSVRLFAFLDTLIHENPNDYEYQVYKGECYATMYNRADLAVAIYKEVLRQSPTNPRAQFALMTHYATTDEFDNFYESIKAVVSNEHIEESKRTDILNAYVRYCIAEDSLRLGSLREFLDSMNYADNATGELSAAHVTLLLYLDASPDSTLMAINRTLHYHPENSQIRRQGLYICYKNDYIPELIRLCEEGQYYDPQMLDYYHLPAIYYLTDNNEDAALATLERGEPYYMESPDDTLAAELFNIMGDLYHQRGNLERCFEVYDSALVLVPDNHLVLNNYAYFLSLEERDLPKALEMAQRANELSPNNATYLDTYAWVLYQLEQFTQAKIYIDQTLAAIKEGEESSTYYKHAGDIYWRVGDRKNARKFWKRAEELEKENL